MNQDLDEKINSDVGITNFDTDSTSVKMSETDFFQRPQQDDKIQQDIHYNSNKNDEDHDSDSILSEPSIPNINGKNKNNKDILSTDSTSISDSSADDEHDHEINNTIGDKTDSTTLDSSEIQSFENMNSNRRKKMRTIINSRTGEKMYNDFLFMRPENNLRKREIKREVTSTENASNSSTPRKKIKTNYNNNNNNNNNTSSTSGRSVYRGIYDPFHIRPNPNPSSKPNQGFDPIPMDAVPKSHESDASSRASKSSRVSRLSQNSKNSLSSRSKNSVSSFRQPKRNSASTTCYFSGLETPTPISGFVVTDGNPSPHQMTLVFQSEDECVINAMNRLIQYGEIPAFEYQRPVIRMLKRESVNAVVNEEYDKAQVMEKAQIYLRDVIEATERERRSECAMNALDNKIRCAENELRTENQEWDELLKSYKENQEIEKQKLIERHKEEQDKFGEKWAQHSTLIPFNKPSSQLIQLRKMQKNLALTKNFAEAKIIKERAEELKKQETAEAEKKIKQAIWTSYQTLLEKQKREIDCFDEHTRRGCDFIDLKKKELTQPIQKLINSLKKGYPCFYITEDNADTKSMAPSSAASSRAKMVSKKKSGPTQATPRTKQTLTDFRKETDPPLLNINTMKIKEYVHAKRSASTCRVSRMPK